MYQIIYKSGEIKDITDEQGKILLEAFCLGKEKFIIGGSLKSFSGVKDIAPVKKDRVDYFLSPVKQEPITQDRHIRQLKGLKKGILKFINSNNNPKPRANKLLEMTELSILRANNDKNFKTTPAKIYGSI